MKKFLSVLLSVCLLLGVFGCVQSPQTQPQSTEQQTQASEQQTESTEQPSSTGYKALYDDIISQYTELLTAKHNGQEITKPDTENMDDRERAIAEATYGIVDACKRAEAIENLGYGYKDLDCNGVPELIILSYQISIKAIFTISNKLPVLLEASYGSNGSFLFGSQNNRFFLSRSTVTNNIAEATFYTCHVEGDKMIYDAIYGKVYDQEKKTVLEIFQTVDGNRTSIDEDVFFNLDREYQKLRDTVDCTTDKLAAPRTHLFLEDTVTDPNLPIADFSSYAAIRKTYLAISECLDEFDSYAWCRGKYDNLFAFPSDRSFEYYNKLLHIAYSGGSDMGYDELDLNGDGVDELVLMTEDYSIKAIFTQKGGVPVLLESVTFGYHTCWLDEEGLIHVDREDYYELEYSLYEYTKSGKYNLLYSICVDEYGRYLTKDGKTEPIDYEASLELYDGYVCYSEHFSPNEHTRNVSDLTYTALAEATEDIIEVATNKTWHKYASLDETTGKDFARSNTYITFENATDTQIEMNVKYNFIFSYPDPDREHYLLDDVTEATLNFTVRKEDGEFVFDENGVKGRVELGYRYVWIIIEQSTDERFVVGNHCYSSSSSESIIQ